MSEEQHYEDVEQWFKFLKTCRNNAQITTQIKDIYTNIYDRISQYISGDPNKEIKYNQVMKQFIEDQNLMKQIRQVYKTIEKIGNKNKMFSDDIPESKKTRTIERIIKSMKPTPDLYNDTYGSDKHYITDDMPNDMIDTDDMSNDMMEYIESITDSIFNQLMKKVRLKLSNEKIYEKDMEIKGKIKDVYNNIYSRIYGKPLGEMLVISEDSEAFKEVTKDQKLNEEIKDIYNKIRKIAEEEQMLSGDKVADDIKGKMKEIIKDIITEIHMEKSMKDNSRGKFVNNKVYGILSHMIETINYEPKNVKGRRIKIKRKVLK